MQLITAPYEFAVISFYKPSDPKSVELDEIVESSMLKLDERIKDGEFTKRSIGWFRVDIDALPEFAYAPDAKPDTLIAATDQSVSKFLHLDYSEKSEEEQVQEISDSVAELTGDWVREIQCDMVQFWERHHDDEVVYYGALEDL